MQAMFTPDERDALAAAIDSATQRNHSCVVDGCQHVAAYLDSGDRDYCACHWSEDEEAAKECEGQPGPAKPYRERLIDAIQDAGFRLVVQPRGTGIDMQR